eukprot:CAMPEP_0185037086 /NCGR_PEP_ID=MMETSP1103-20130426/31005_1 /TAXON_ID=36769 /ORGANISM="Paraphysomonas bandaiensis, Strain Caron Lab Isolate" /LENGTH=245 /DNA_ID=CAMNT_0027574897 /DNA_START=50 /DNA_END=787 /DNA_ORIENTATION=+
MVTCIKGFTTTPKRERKHVIFFGDSITQFGYAINEGAGWISRLGEWWSRKVDITNRGFSGYNTRWGLEVFEKTVILMKPDLLFIFFGANDAAIESSVQYVPLQEYESNLRSMVASVKERLPATDIIIITPPPIYEEKLKVFNMEKGKGSVVDRFNDRTYRYVEAAEKVGREFTLPVVNAWKGMEGDSELRKDYLIDGIHLNEKGNKQLFSLIVNKVNSYYPYWTPTEMNMHLPPWQDVAEQYRRK